MPSPSSCERVGASIMYSPLATSRSSWLVTNPAALTLIVVIPRTAYSLSPVNDLELVGSSTSRFKRAYSSAFVSA